MRNEVKSSRLRENRDSPFDAKTASITKQRKVKVIIVIDNSYKVMLSSPSLISQLFLVAVKL